MELSEKIQYVGTISSPIRWMSRKRVMISYDITLMSLAHTMPDRMNPGWSGASVPLDRLPSGAVKLRIDPKNLTPGRPNQT